jgi:Ca-activated chloride channel family protein
MRRVWLILVFACTAWLSAQNIQPPSNSPDNVPFRLEVTTSLVSVDVGVYDKNEKAVTNLGKADFQVYEDGVLQPIRSFTPVSSGYRILLLIDHSGSMRILWPSLLEGLNIFMKNLRPQDQVAIATFDNNVEVAMPWRGAKEGNTEKIRIAPDGRGTEIWSSLNWAVSEVSRSNGRKGVIVFTDGEDRGADFEKVRKKAVDSEIPFYFVGMTTENTLGGVRMKQFAEATGGKAYFPKSPAELAPLYETIAQSLGTSYTIAYSPLKPAGDNKLRRIEIRPIDLRLHLIQSRSAYYAK